MKPHFIAIFLPIALISAFALANVQATPTHIKYRQRNNYPDAFLAPDLPMRSSKTSLAATSPGSSPGYYETSEYMIGSVAVGVIFLESDGTIDTSTENWTPSEESQVVSEIQIALNWWQSQNPSASVTFASPSVHYPVPTRYEPINRPHTDQGLWISDAMSYLGYSGTGYFTQVRDYINSLRNEANTDWGFAIFVVDSSNDADGAFTDKTSGGWYYFAYAYLGGPFLVMTYDNDGWGINRMDQVTAHEMGHIFYATDEYNGVTEYSGYLNVADVEGSGALMDNNNWWLSSGTKGQIGWRDSDIDGLQDIVDTFPDTLLNQYLPDPTADSTSTYTGTVAEVPYKNNNPRGPGTDITINTIFKVEFRVDSSTWLQASASDGIFDEAEESFTFTTSTLSTGAHTIYARGINSVGNTETSLASDTVTVILDQTSPVTNISYSSPSYVNGTTTYVSTETKFTLTASDTGSGVANTYYRVDSASWTLYNGSFTLSALADGAHMLNYYSRDKVGNTETTKSLELEIDNTEPAVSLVTQLNESAVALSNVNVSWNGSDTGSGIDHYETKLDSEEYLNKGTATSQLFSSLSEGTHTAYIKAFDKLGNIKEIHVVFLVDISKPTVTLIFPEPQILTNLAEVEAGWRGKDTVSGIDHYEVKLDNGMWTNMGSSTTYLMLEITDGSHKFTVKAVDKAGNTAEASVTFMVDTTSPSITMIKPLDGNETRSSTIVASWNGLDNTSGINHYEVRIDGKAWVNVGTNTTYTIKQLSDETHTLQVKAIDNAGNVQETKTNFSVNTSLIGGSGWIDDILFFAAISTVIALVAVTILLQRRRDKLAEPGKDAANLPQKSTVFPS